MKKFELTLVVRKELPFPVNFEVQIMDKVEADDLIHLLSQFQFVLVNVMKKLHEEAMIVLRNDDDIPF